MTLVTDLELPLIDTLDEALRGDRYRELMAATEGHDGWLRSRALRLRHARPESPGEFFLRSRDAMFPSMTLAALFNVTEGPLYKEISKNLITRHGEDHSRLRGLVNPALAPRRAETYRPAIRAHTVRADEPAAGSDNVEFIGGVRRSPTPRG